jgi:hypothetical protein
MFLNKNRTMDNVRKHNIYINLPSSQTFTSYRLRVFENKVLRRIFGPKRAEVTEGWRKLYNEERHNLYYSPSIIRMIKSRGMRWTWLVGRMGEKRNAYRILMGKPDGKRPLKDQYKVGE